MGHVRYDKQMLTCEEAGKLIFGGLELRSVAIMSSHFRKALAQIEAVLQKKYKSMSQYM